jgi:hypothetical protein
MDKYELSPEQAKILAGMDKVYENLIAFKKKMNSELVIMRDGKIAHVKPEDMETLEQIKERREREKLLK